MNIGIIGCGKIAQVRHIPEYAANPHAVLAGYYDLNLQRAQELAAHYGGRAYESVDALLADPEIHAVSVCAANHAHAEIAIKALHAGKHVLCEKPMATTLADCEAMVAAAEATGRFLMVAHNQRLAGAHVRARQLVEEGAIGTLLTFRTTFGHSGPETWSIETGKGTWFFDPRRAAMGAMADLGVHKTDLLHFLTGQRIVEATAKVVTLDKRDASGALIGVDDNAICIYRLSGGAVGTMTASWTYYGPEDNSTVLYGTRGILRICEDPAHALVLQRPDGTAETFDAGQIQTNDRQTSSGVIDLWMDCLVHRRAPEISGREALSAMRAVFAAMESARTGASVPVDLS